jgi:hypothetical protein
MKCPICSSRSDYPNLPQEIAKYEAAAATAARRELKSVVTDLYDAGFKNPLVTIECAIAYLENPTVPGHPEKQKVERTPEKTVFHQTEDLKDEDKPGCFGAIGLPGMAGRKDCPCQWAARCKQSQEDY